jgi:hypothetical protein
MDAERLLVYSHLPTTKGTVDDMETGSDVGGHQRNRHMLSDLVLMGSFLNVETVILHLVQEAQDACESGPGLGGEARAQLLADGLDGNTERFLNEKRLI